MSGIGTEGLGEGEGLGREACSSDGITSQLPLPGTEEPGIRDCRDIGSDTRK